LLAIPSLHRLRASNRLKKSAIVFANFLIIVVIASLVVNNSKTASVSASSLNNSDASSVNPLDQVSSSDIALTVAQVSNLPEATAVANQSQSAAADLAMAATANTVVAKPEVVTTALKSKADIFGYKTSAGDSVASLAAKFGVTSNSIMWSNGLTSNTLNANTNLVIPPVNGIVYTVKAGDTPASLATTYKANAAKITAYNDAEIGGLTAGERIIIPDATLPTISVTTSSPDSVPGVSGNAAFPWGSGPIYGSNGYDYGYCTWYVATQISVPSNWGNAATWAYYASLSGWNVAVKPTVGAIAQTADAAGGEGHVAVVDAVSADGSQIQTRDMNGIAGWGKVGYSTWIPATTFQHFITP
jgi:surface antigen